MAETNQIIKKEAVSKSALAKQTEHYTTMIVSTFSQINLQCTDYQKICVANMIARMNELLTSKGLNFNSIDQSNITAILSQVAMLQLNITAVPSECYIQLRNFLVDKEWKKRFEFGIEGNGNDAILRRYGVEVESVRSPWIVREGDDFTYPSYSGLEVVPPTWGPKSYTNKVIRVVYPVIKKDNSVEWLISERADVAKNLRAHIANNLLGNDYKEIRPKIITKISDMSLEAMLEDTELRPFISPAWYSGASREDMILRKLKNNATKKYPKNFENSFAASAYEKTYDDYDQYRTAVADAEVVNEKTNAIEEMKQKVDKETGTISMDDEDIQDNKNDTKQSDGAAKGAQGDSCPF